jgi:putative FmdB family regulatory protein
MPTYEFRCPKGHDFEKFYRSIAAAPSEVSCPTCGLVAERRMSVGGGLVFKGSGFYITDYGKDGKKPQGGATPAKDAPATGSASQAASTDSGAPKADAGGAAGPASGDPKSSSTAKPEKKDTSSSKPKSTE